MFEPSATPRFFGLPPGVDFARALVAGLLDRYRDAPPEDLARVEIYVNTSRMQRRIRDVFDDGKAALLPRIRLVTDLARDPVSGGIAPPVAPLRRRLELSQFVAKLLEKEPDLAPRSALYDLSDSLARLMDEMQGEGVGPDVLAKLDVPDQSGHWDRALKFLRIIAPFFATDTHAPDKEARQRAVITALAQRWETTPPPHPVIVAGSTGSRGATALFMQAVARLPLGAVVLPGFDFDLQQPVWDALSAGAADDAGSEDHPQFRFHKLMQAAGLSCGDIRRWHATPPADPARNRLVSLSLRPAPVTSQWLEEGPHLGDLLAATQGLTLVEAPTPRAEAETIALRLRQAIADGTKAALISPDRMLTRQVTAALDRWDIVPDDSAGIPLQLSPPGRMLRQVAALFGMPLTSEALLSLLKHPLAHSGGSDRGPHLLHTRNFELFLRRKTLGFPSMDTLNTWADDDPQRKAWAAWVGAVLTGHDGKSALPLASHVARHIALTERLCAGPDADGAGKLWLEKAGREARRVCQSLQDHADAGGMMTDRDYAALFSSILAQETVRDPEAGHPDILIWGTLEARVETVDLAILGGMNDGVWPEATAADPWLNRAMRAKAGLLLPERQIGLSAHDYQQAIAGPEVWITRAKRSSDAETVPSRWVNRLTNLLDGLPANNGPDALEAMRNRGAEWCAKAMALSSQVTPASPARRPSPQPPATVRPKDISVTSLKTLIRDPFAIYAQRILRLRQLDPLVPTADAPLRGTIIHKILERFIAEGHAPDDAAAFRRITREEFSASCPWPTIRAQWIARMDRVCDRFLQQEGARRGLAPTQVIEKRGQFTLPKTGVTLICKADRIDITDDGQALIYDYKSGAPPTKAQQLQFDKQLLAEAVMVEAGAFRDIGPLPVAAASFLGLNAKTAVVAAPLDDEPVQQTQEWLETLFRQWQQPERGYSARMAMERTAHASDYDHLSRFGEWDETDEVVPEVLR